MRPEMSKKVNQRIPMLLPLFSASNPLEIDTKIVRQFLSEVMPVRIVALVRAIKQTACVWCCEGDTEEKRELEDRLCAHMDALLASTARDMDAVLLAQLRLAPSPVMLIPVCFNRQKYGFLLVQRQGKDWLEDEREILQWLARAMGATFAARMSMENEQLSNFVFNTVLDSMKSSIYITDIETDRILFMNQTMKKDFGLMHPEGQKCWKVLQRGMEKRCDFCSIPRLKRGEETMVQWDETNTVTGLSYRNYDSLIRWIDGSHAHLQQSIDVTEFKADRTDELTQMLTRRAGKETLRRTIEKMQMKKEIFTVCMYDINDLKKVNDQYGHAEGDRLLRTAARAVREALAGDDYGFRLSGDEFVAVLHCSHAAARRRMNKAVRALNAADAAYEMGFCYGLQEVQPEDGTTVDEVLFLADERMYEQKRRFHILMNERRRSHAVISPDGAGFVYDSKKLYQALVQSTDEYIYIGNMKTGIFRYPKAMVEEFDLPGEVIENAAAVWGAKVHKSDRAAFLEANQEIADGRTVAHCVEYRAKNRRGDWVWIRCRGHVVRDENGDPELFAGFITNLGQKTRIDNLTGLFNKLEFEAQARRLIEKEEASHFAMLVLGLDDLKHVNDLYDRVFGDEVIRITAQKLQSLLPGTASLFRLDGDEFGVLLRGVDRTELERICRAVHHSFDMQQDYDGKKYYCSISGGCSFYPRDAGDFLSLFKYASYSMEFSKKHGKKRCTFFSQELLSYREHILAMVEELRASVENDCAGFSLRYQPLVEAQSGELVGMEALCRWHCERFGEVSPVEFIPILEETGMIVQVGKWVFREAIHTSKAWCVQKPDLGINVNLSYHQISGDDFVPFMREVIQQEEYAPRNLVIEMTESFFAQQNEHADTVFAAIHDLGVRIAMDDFGTGYSALGILKRAPADIVKIDKAFIRDILTSSFDATFIRFVVALCHDVGIQVCLEGVETEEEFKLVQTMGLDTIQGFYFSKPLTEQEFTAKYFG